MYKINKEKNIVESLEEATFSELGFRERENLLNRLNQDWAGFMGLAGCS